jgi:hypothetical protein
VGKSLLVANLALALAAGIDRLGFSIPTRRRVLICQFELPVPQFVSRLTHMRRALGAAADQHLLVDTRASGHLLSSAQGLNHFVSAAPAAAAEVLVLDPLYSTHDQDENDTRAMAALCQSLLRLRDTSRAALVVVHHVRKSIGRHEIGSAFRGSSALHAVGTVICCSPGRLRNSPPSSFVSSFATRPRSLHDCSNSIPALCGSPRPRSRLPLPQPDAKSKRLTSHRHWPMWAMRRGWLRRNRLTTTLPHTIWIVRGRVGLLLLAAFNFQALHTPQPAPSQNQVHFFGEVSERRPWA